MASDLPSKTPGTSGGSYVRLAVIMLLIAVALVVGKIALTHSEQSEPSAAVAVSAQPKVEVAPPPPPPPPPEEPSASASASAAPVAKVAKGGGGCTGECKGEVSAELRTYLAGRAAQGRKCYERALLQNGSLKGRMRVQVRLNPSGQLCNAAMASDELQDPGLSACIIQMFRNSVYPAPKGGCVDVAVPMAFVPQH
jgi:hypothetical protein